jgi:hypothetical protein
LTTGVDYPFWRQAVESREIESTPHIDDRAGARVP